MPSFRKAFFNFFNSQTHLQYFTPENKEQLLQKYRDSVGLTKDVSFSPEAFDQHAEKRVTDHTSFKTSISKDNDDKESALGKKLNEDAKDSDAVKTAKTEVRNKFKEVFKTEDFYTRAQDRYKETIEAFKDLVKKVPDPYSVGDIRGNLDKVQANARKAIEAQQKEEMIKLKNALDDSDYIQKFKTALEIDNPQKVKDDLIKEVAKSHREQLAEFDKATQANLSQLDKASAAETERLIFTAQLEGMTGALSAKDRQQMLAEMDRIRAVNRQNQGIKDDGNVSAEVDVDKRTISAIDPKDLKFILSITGQKLEQNESGLWTVKMPPRILNPFYYLGFPANKEKPKVDMLTMAQAVRASGFDAITMNVNFVDEETSKMRAKQAYEACLESGFPPEKIKIKVNGVEQKPEDIFKDSPDKLAQIKADATNTQRKLNELKETTARHPSSEENTQRIKGELVVARNAARAKAGKTAITEAEEKSDQDKIETVLKK